MSGLSRRLLFIGSRPGPAWGQCRKTQAPRYGRRGVVPYEQHAAAFGVLRLGVVINSFGVALITLGNLGTSAISSVPYVCSLQFPMFSFGVTTFIWNILLILVQVVLLRRDFKPSQFL